MLACACVAARPQTIPLVTLSAEEKSLVAGSKQAILQAGISEPYFARHFTLVGVSAKPGDRRVVWRYRVNEYETLVHDVIGFYTDAGRRVDTHTVTRALASANEIEHTIPRRRATRLLRACVGRYDSAAVVYQSLVAGEPTTLYLTAQSAPRKSARAERAERERAEKERDAAPGLREEDEDAPPILIGYVNLETGKCSKVRGIVR